MVAVRHLVLSRTFSKKNKNPKLRKAALLKIEKWPYYSNRLIDRREIWSGNANDPVNPTDH